MGSTRLVIFVTFAIVVQSSSALAGAQPTYGEIWARLDSGRYESVIETVDRVLETDSTQINLLQLEVRAGLMSAKQPAYLDHVLHDSSGAFLSEWRRLLLEWELGHCRHIPALAERQYARTHDCWSQFWLARALVELGREDSALGLYQKLLDSAVCRRFALAELADIYSQRQEYAKSDSLILQIESSSDVGILWQGRRAWNQAFQGDWIGALKNTRLTCQRFPIPFYAYSEIRLLRGLGRYRQSFTSAQAALRRWPASKRLQEIAIACAEKIGNFRLADSLLGCMTSFQRGYLGVSTLADRALTIGDTLAFDTAMRTYIEANIDDAWEASSYARWLRRRNRNAEADALIDSVHRCASAQTDIWLRVALASENMPSNALDTLLTIAPRSLNIPALSLWHVILRYNEGSVDSAHQIADTLLNHFPGNLGLIIELLKRDIAFRRFERTDEWLERLARAGYDTLETGLIRLQRHLSRGETGNARRLLDSLVSLSPTYPNLIWYLPKVYGDEDNLEKLHKLTLNYLAVKDIPPAVCVDLTPVLGIAHQGRTADSLLTGALLRYPNASTLYYLRGMVRSDLGDYQASSADLANAKALDPFNPDLAQASTTNAQKGLTLDQAGTPAEKDTTAMPHLSVDSIRTLARAAAADSSDDCVVLADHEQQIYDISGHHLRRTHRIVWARTAEGARSLGSASYAFNGYRETPRVLIARTIEPNGSIHDVPPEKLFISNQESSMSDSRIVTWAYPLADSGAIVEALIQFEGSYNEPLDVYDLDVFTETFRVVSRQLELRTPALWPVITRRSAGIRHHEEHEGGVVINAYSATHLSKYIEEEQMPGAAEQCEWVRYAYQKTWKQEVEFYWPRVADKIDTGKPMKELAGRLLKGARSRSERIDALYRFVADSIRYEAINFGEGTTVPRLGSATLNNGFGDCKDKTVLLLSLLRAAGIEGFPALLNTHDPAWFDQDVPDMAQFNHMIAFVPSADKPWLDPTCSVCRPGDIGPDNQGRPALIVRLGEDQPLDTIPTQTAEEDQLVRNIRVVPKDEGGSTFNMNITYTGPVALSLRTNVPQSSPTGLRKYFESQMAVGLVKKARLIDCAVTELSPKGLTYNMTARFVSDSTFGKGDSYARVPINLYQVGNRFDLPDTVNRRLDVQRDQLFSLRERVTVIPGKLWELYNCPVSWEQENLWFKAACLVQSYEDSISITSSFVLKNRRIGRSDYPTYYRLVEQMHKRLHDQSPLFRHTPDSARLGALKLALAKAPADPSLLVSMAREYLGEDFGGDGCKGEKYRATAVELFTAALAASPDNEMTLMRLAPLLISAGRLKKADSVLHAFSGAESMPVLLNSLRAAVAVQLGRHSEAIPMLEKVLASSPDDRLRSTLVLWYIAADQLENARKQLDLMETLHADSANLLQAKLAYYLEAKDWLMAENVLKHWPDTSASVLTRLRLSIPQSKRDYESVVTATRKMLDDTPEDYWALNTLAWALYNLGKDLPDALAMANRALAIRGDCDAAIRNTRGAILLKLGRIDDAEQDFLAALSDETARARSVNLYFLGKCSVLLKQPEKARNYFTESAALNGDKEYVELSRAELAKL